MNWEYIIENWAIISAILFSCAAFVLSPLVKIRTIRAKSKLEETTAVIQEDKTLREHLDGMNAKIDLLTEEVQKLKEERHMDRINLITITAERDRYMNENTELRRHIDEAGI